MTNLPFLPWFPARFISATRGWSVTARGVYRELLDCQWEMGSLPSSAPELKQLIGATAHEWKCWPGLVELKFPLDSDGRRRNQMLEQHRTKSLWIRRRNSEGGINGNRERWKDKDKKVVSFPKGGSGNES